MATPRSPCGSADSAGKTVKAPDPQLLTIAPSSPVTGFPNTYEETSGTAPSVRYARRRAGPGAGTPRPRARVGERVPEKSSSVLREGAAVSEKYEFIDAECAILPAEGDAPAVV